jgi:hypothetical protein
LGWSIAIVYQAECPPAIAQSGHRAQHDQMIVLILAVTFILVAFVAGGSSTKRAPLRPTALPRAPDENDASNLPLDDPIAALLRDGTPADAARLAEHGVDLRALGYRPPGE